MKHYYISLKDNIGFGVHAEKMEEKQSIVSVRKYLDFYIKEQKVCSIPTTIVEEVNILPILGEEYTIWKGEKI